MKRLKKTPGFFLVARNTLAADSTRHLLRDAGHTVAGIAHTAAEALDWAAGQSGGILMVGSELDDATGLDVMRLAAMRQPALRRILFVRATEPEYIRHVWNEGVDGLLSPDCLVADMLQCAAAVCDGQRYLYGPLRDLLLRRFGPGALLSCRELEILALIAGGLSSSAIAGRLHLSLHTVNRHRANMAEKLDLHGPNALALFAARRGPGKP